MKKRCLCKIVMVGGGSYNWSPKLLTDIMQTPEMENSEIVILDPNLTAAREIKAAGDAIAKALNKQYKITATKSETSAFKDADFVLITISTGDLEMMEHDLTIPEKYGIYQTVGDTVGPGGWSRSLRNVPVFVKMARKIEKLSPNAVVLNYTNPMSTLTAAFHQASSLKTVGLCHGVFSNYRILERIFKVDERDLSVNFGGVNHFFWITDFTVKGKPGYPLLRSALSGKSIDALLKEGDTDEVGFHSHHALCNELFNEYGYLPFVADRHTCEFIPGFLTPKASELKKFNLKRTFIKDRRALRKRNRQKVQKMGKGKLEIGDRSRETAVDIMKAFILQQPFCDVVNLPNIGQVDNLPRGATVETLGLVDASGFRPLAAGALPDTIAELVRPHCVVQKMTLEAAITGDRKLALDALMLDPICGFLAPSTIKKMGNELIEATHEWLPQF